MPNNVELRRAIAGVNAVDGGLPARLQLNESKWLLILAKVTTGPSEGGRAQIEFEQKAKTLDPEGWPTFALSTAKPRDVALDEFREVVADGTAGADGAAKQIGFDVPNILQHQHVARCKLGAPGTPLFLATSKSGGSSRRRTAVQRASAGHPTAVVVNDPCPIRDRSKRINFSAA